MLCVFYFELKLKVFVMTKAMGLKPFYIRNLLYKMGQDFLDIE